jgi:hypothetical protein
MIAIRKLVRKMVCLLSGDVMGDSPQSSVFKDLWGLSNWLLLSMKHDGTRPRKCAGILFFLQMSVK